MSARRRITPVSKVDPFAQAALQKQSTTKTAKNNKIAIIEITAPDEENEQTGNHTNAAINPQPGNGPSSLVSPAANRAPDSTRARKPLRKF